MNDSVLTLDKLRRAAKLLEGASNMGCDIHMWVEYQPYEDHWYSFTDNFNPGRDYHMFNIMANCGRNDGDVKQLYDNKMLPDKMSWSTEEALKEDNDLHGHSWLSFEEFAHCMGERILSNEYGPPDVPWDVVLCTMKAFEERGVPTRLIFAFDN